MKLSLCPLSCVFLISHGWSWNESKYHFYCTATCSMFFSSSKWSWKKSISLHMMVNPQMVLKGVQNTLYTDGLERSKNPRGISHGDFNAAYWGFLHGGCTLYNSNVMVLKGVNLMLFSTVYVSDGLERSQFCSYTQWSWKESISYDLP